MFSNEAYLDGLAECVDRGLCRAVGVSNFNADRLRRAHARLAERGVPLASNQIQYSLLYRAPETSGVLQACRDLGVTPVAYSPLAQGLLTGKFGPGGGGVPSGPRRATQVGKGAQAEPVVAALRSVGADAAARLGLGEGAAPTPAQVALRWCCEKGTLPIPGGKNARQIREAAGALGWRLT